MKKDLVKTYMTHKCNTDKYNLGYLDNFYQEFFDKHYDDIKTMLEIGVKKGGSLKLWAHYFENADIHGVDISQPVSVNGAKVYKSNAYSKEFVNKFDDKFFDLVIDDGPHTYQSWLDLIDLYYDKIKDGGYLIIEDIILPLNKMGATAPQIKELIKHAELKGFSFEEQRLFMGLQKTERLLNMWSKHLSILVFKK